jgi:quercetin dioxygenase-like cupin family protein
MAILMPVGEHNAARHNGPVAEPGQVLENPSTAERLVFRDTAGSTGGKLLRFELTFRPRGYTSVKHVQPHQEERHEVLKGALGVEVDGVKQTLGVGEAVSIPPGAVHRLFSVEEGMVDVLFEVRPALRSERLIEAFFRLAQEDKLWWRGYPNPLQLAVLAHTYRDEGHPTFPPYVLQKAGAALLAPLGRRLGYQP